VFLLGGVNGSEQVAAHRMRTELGLTVSAYSPPFGFERDPAATSHIIQLINGFKPDMLFVHVGAPKSEVWLHEHFDKLDVTLAFSFGIALEYFAGTRRRAPQWVQRAGFEWLYRLCQEPGRLWKRYTIGSAQFGAIALREILRRYLWGDS
jgi:N-acetylglucosaminyldiphosphoundecaprenol N-acetyl-beta-D-mannosaminyltransferase